MRDPSRRSAATDRRSVATSRSSRSCKPLLDDAGRDVALIADAIVALRRRPGLRFPYAGVVESSDSKRAREAIKRLEREPGFEPMPANEKTKPGETQVTLVSKVLGLTRPPRDV
jgi:hypothetical protein